MDHALVDVARRLGICIGKYVPFTLYGNIKLSEFVEVACQDIGYDAPQLVLGTNNSNEIRYNIFFI